MTASFHARFLAVAPWLLWSGVALAILGPAPLMDARRVVGLGVDLEGTVWMHDHLRRALSGATPFFRTTAQYWPEGKDLLTDTGGNILDALLSIPFQLLWGAPDFLDPYTIVLLTVNAWAMARLLRHLGATPAAAALLGALYELDPYLLHEVGQGRTTQATVFFLPLAITALLRLPEGGVRRGVTFGALVLLHGYIYWYNIYFFVLGLTPLALVLLLRQPRKVAPALLIAVGVALIGALPFLIAVKARLDAGVFPRLAWVGGHAGSPLGRPGVAQVFWSQYQGLTWPIVAALALLGGRRALPWLVGTLACLGLALGTRIVGDHVLHVNPYAVFLYEHVPLIPRLAFPERLGSVMSVLLLAAVGLSAIGRRPWLAGALFAFALGEAALTHHLPVPFSTFERPKATDAVAARGGAVIVLPFGMQTDQLIHQVRHGQPIFGGMAERDVDFRPSTTTRRMRNAFYVMLASTMRKEDRIGYRPADRDEIRHDFRWVWLDRRYGGDNFTARTYDVDGKIARLTEELGEPLVADPFVVLWDLERAPPDPPGFTLPLPDQEQQQRMETSIRAVLWSRGLRPVRAKGR